MFKELLARLSSRKSDIFYKTLLYPKSDRKFRLRCYPHAHGIILAHTEGIPLRQSWTILHFAGPTKESPEFPVSSARRAWERIHWGLRGPARFIVDSAAHTHTHPHPGAINGSSPLSEGSGADLLWPGSLQRPTALSQQDQDQLLPPLSQCDLTQSFAQTLTQLLHSHTSTVKQRELSVCPLCGC